MGALALPKDDADAISNLNQEQHSALPVDTEIDRFHNKMLDHRSSFPGYGKSDLFIHTHILDLHGNNHP